MSIRDGVHRAFITLSSSVIEGVLEVKRGSWKSEPYVYWHFSSENPLGSQEERVTASSEYKHIKNDEELDQSLKRMGVCLVKRKKIQ